MLSPHLEKLLQEQISTDLRVKGSTQRDVEQRALGPWAARGGGLRPEVVKAQALVAEVGVRAAAISAAIVKVLQDVRVSPDTGLVDDLVRLFESRYDLVLSELQPAITSYWPPGDDRMANKIEDFRAEHRMEVKRAAERAVADATERQQAERHHRQLIWSTLVAAVIGALIGAAATSWLSSRWQANGVQRSAPLAVATPAPSLTETPAVATPSPTEASEP